MSNFFFSKLFIAVFFIVILFSLSSMFEKVDAAVTGYGPSQVKQAYNLPETGGSGTVAIVLWGNPPNLESDLNQFSQQFNLPSCTQDNGCLTIHLMGGANQPDVSNANTEISMDTQWVHGIAPGAKILVVEAASATTGNLLSAIDYAIKQPGVTEVSMSFGNSGADGQIPCDVFSNPSISYFASAGDDGNDLSWPAVCPQVISVGGTRLIMNGGSVVQETAWSCSYGELNPQTGGPSCTGGGLSQMIPQPSYQSAFGIPNANGFRGVPDVSAIADPAYGGIVIVNGAAKVVGGTSLSAPIWAGISALNSIPITHESLYTNASASTYASYYRDITQGDDGNCGAICIAGVGYDFVTGLGSPIALPGSSGNASPNPSISPSPGVSPTSIPVSYSIFGNVFNDVNRNGVKDSGDTNVSGVQIALSGAVGGSKTTDSNGNYTFDNLIAGSYTLTFTYQGQSTSANVTLTDIDNSREVDLGIEITNGQAPVIVPITPTPTPTPTAVPPGSGGGGSGGSSGGGDNPGFQPHGSPTPTPSQYYTCVTDPTCAKGGNTIQLCPLKCSPI
jgi:subtilase family serine protease